MKRAVVLVSGLVVLAFPFLAAGQLGMDVFRKPSIAKAFHPVVGKGAEYETTTQQGASAKTTKLELGVVGKDTVDGKDGYWLEFVTSDDKGKTMVGKSLFTAGDFEFHRMIVQTPEQGAMELSMNMPGMQRGRTEVDPNAWKSRGPDTVTVPAGTFACEHWKNEKDGAEAWTSDKVTPFGMIKETGKSNSMVLTKILNEFPERITGPVKKFDMQEMMQQMQQRRQP